MVLSGLSDQDKDTVDNEIAPLLGDIPAAQYLFRNNVKMTKNKTVLILLTPRRASLTLADGTPIEAEAEVDEQNLVKLEDGVSWLKPASNLRSIVNHLSRYGFSINTARATSCWIAGPKTLGQPTHSRKRWNISISDMISERWMDRRHSISTIHNANNIS